MKPILPLLLTFVALPASVTADTKPAPQILVTYQVLEVPGDLGIPSRDPYSDPTSSTAASKFYKAATQNAKSEVTEISIQTAADSPAEARYNRILTFSAQDHGKPTRCFLDLPMSLEATPHINPDGTITVQLKTEVTHTASVIGDEVPLTNSESWDSQQTFKSGEIRMFGVGPEFTSMRLLAGNSPKAVAENKKLIASQNKLFVPFVTVTILPDEKTAMR